MAAIVLDDAQRARCRWPVKQVFARFAEWIAELLAYATTADGTSQAA